MIATQPVAIDVAAGTVLAAPVPASEAEELAPPARQEFSREVRLGVVLYGGVSLAIYINGVTQEFARAVRGQRGYRWIKALTDSDVVVDVISGTSAGGINGIALALALCNDYDLGSLPKLWREHGDISGLLNPPNSNRPPVHSLLSGDVYQSKLKDAFVGLAEHPFEHECGSKEYVSRTTELDMFITGTYLDGFQWVEFDDRGHAMQIEDHRALFRLKYRRLRESNPDLSPDTRDPSKRDTLFEALGKLARLTSGFPGAFPPVHVGEIDPQATQLTADGLLHRWGQIPSSAGGYYVDGGVLDNKPFTSTLEAIFSRATTRDVNRMLLYVEPDPAEVKTPVDDTGEDDPSRLPPNFAQTLIRARIDIPFVETTTDDLKQLADHNRGVVLYNRIATELRAYWRDGVSGPRRADNTEATSVDTTPLVGEALMFTYDRSRLVDLSQRIAQSVFNSRRRIEQTAAGRQEEDGKRQPEEQTPSERAAAFLEYFDSQIRIQESTKTWLLDNDIFFLRRRVYHLIYLLHESLYAGGSSVLMTRESKPRQQRMRLRAALNRQAELYDILRGALGLLVEEAPVAWQQAIPETLWAVVMETGARTLDHAAEKLPANYRDLIDGPIDEAGDRAFSDAMSDLNTTLRAFVRSQHRAEIDELASAEARSGPLRLVEMLGAIETWAIDETIGNDDLFKPLYTAFRDFDAALFPLEVVGRLGEKDKVEVVRISAIDATRGFSNRRFREKLSGDGVMHFGGFFKRSWRSNDILWGRLDGCCQLMECLFERERFEALIANQHAREKLRDRFFKPAGATDADSPKSSWQEGMDPRVLFRHSGAATHEALERWLRTLLDGPADTAPAVTRDDFETHLTMLVEAEQLEILYEEVPNVIGDALVEQEMWNRYEFAFPGVSPLPALESNEPQVQNTWRFRHTGNRRVDPYVALTAAAEYVQGATDSVFHDLPDNRPSGPMTTQMGSYFTERYKVGSEALTRDIPTVALLGIMARTLLVLRTCLLNLFGESSGRVQQSLLYRYGLDLPLRGFYGFTVLWRSWAGAKAAVFFGFTIISVVLLAIGLFFWSAIIWPDRFYMNRFLLFVAVPVIALYIQFQALLLGAALARVWKFSLFLLLTLIAATLLVTGILSFDDIWDREGADRRNHIIGRLVVPALFLYVVTRYVFWMAVDALVAGLRRSASWLARRVRRSRSNAAVAPPDNEPGSSRPATPANR